VEGGVFRGIFSSTDLLNRIDREDKNDNNILLDEKGNT